MIKAEKRGQNVIRESNRFFMTMLMCLMVMLCISMWRLVVTFSYCDEDVSDWVDFLKTRGYECRVLGDAHKSSYPRHDGLATRVNMRQAVQTLAAHADTESILFFSSGHGNGDGKGSSSLCTYEGGDYYDTELAKDLAGAHCNTVVILDHCLSGGFCPELEKLDNIFAL